jgi:hypothetical protein
VHASEIRNADNAAAIVRNENSFGCRIILLIASSELVFPIRQAPLRSRRLGVSGFLSWLMYRNQAASRFVF